MANSFRNNANQDPLSNPEQKKIIDAIIVKQQR